MKWKLVGGLVIISLLLLFFYSRARVGSLEFSKYFSFQSIGKLIESMEVYIQDLINPAERFEAQIEINMPSFYGQLIELSKSNVSLEGNCSSLEIDGIKIIKSEKSCRVKANVESGVIKFDKVVEISGATNEFYINNDRYVKKVMNFKLQVEPSLISITNVGKRKMRIESATGEIRKYENGSLDQLKVVNNERIEIYNFFGSISLKDGVILLTGTSTKISGENFDFRK
jgi:hypothetical protein